ncbi:matrix metalloproteinase-28 isoform X2 [Pantherophis guttatus]|uniref:Matrix metalloproteinase-28 isoform X2 n=1 Tax=Pantherophis guttatus TaxID=94885 RepID=A0A6P9BYE8_PANGU|nr:matrix metalloproteinase-28 isoform X2 [Pantherophis guttatus]
MAAAAAAAALIAALLGLLPAQTSTGAAGRSQPGEAQRFLEKYGYFESVHQVPDLAGFPDAIKEFQWISHLPLSGTLDAITLRHMSLPRCGVNDAESHMAWKERMDALFSEGKARKSRRKRYLHQSGKWYKRHLTYRLINWPWYLPEQQVRLAVKAAFELWSNVSSLVFWEVAEEPADIRLTFFYGDHNDGVENAFDGPGKPSRGPIVQLPGKSFARFQDGKQYLENREQNQETTFRFHYCMSFFDALTVDTEDNLYIFKGKYYWIVSKGESAAGPYLLQARWPGLPSAIDATAFSEKDRKFYFFKGGRCWRYKGSSLEVGFPQKCSLTGDLPRHPDTALFFQPLHQLVLFKGPKYYVVNEEVLQVEPYYPRSLKDWGGVPALANGAVTHQDGFVYFFRNDQFWKFNPEKLEVVETGKWAVQLRWLGCQDVSLNQAGA